MKILITIISSLFILGCSKDKSIDIAKEVCLEKFANISIGNQILYVKTACTQEELQTGLMNIKKMDADVGMLFVYGFEKKLSFWMKNTYIPLDIAFINDKLEIVDIQKMKPHDTTQTISKIPASYALEVNSGFFEKNQIKVGDKVNLLIKKTSSQ